MEEKELHDYLRKYRLVATERSVFDTGTTVNLLFIWSMGIKAIGRPTLLYCKGLIDGKMNIKKRPIEDFDLVKRNELQKET